MTARTLRVQALLSCLGLLCTCLLSACYFPRQAAFERSVRQEVQVNMPVATAQQNLRKIKLSCRRQGPELDCTRLREGIFLSCIQRVVLKPSEPQELVMSIDMREIACMGGFG
jgi:hypothetical protein